MSILIAIFILNLLIAVHELGHFLAAKFCKVGVEEFSLGMGPKIISTNPDLDKNPNSTKYSLRWILLGGYVRLNEEEFEETSWWKQLIIIAAGVVFNLIFAILGIWLYLMMSDRLNVGFFAGLTVSTKLAFTMIAQIFAVLLNTFKSVDTSAFAGPVGVVDTISTYVNSGFINAVEIFSVLNLNLFIMNLLPIPILDGGQMLLIIVKRIFKKRELPKFETIWNITGIVILSAIFVFAMKNDIVSIFIK